MTASTVDQLVSDYLNRLDAAAASLPSARRAELVQEIREHIDAARAAGAAADEATVRTMLDRLGEPEEIVAAARDEAAPAEPVVAASPPRTGLELAAVLLLTVGSFVPLVGWAVGVVLLWGSRRWTRSEKLLGTLVVPGGPGMALWLGVFAPGQTCVEVQQRDGAVASECTGFSMTPWIGVLLFVTMLIAPFIVAGLLYSRARDRAAAEPPVMHPVRPVRATTASWTGIEIATVLILGLGGLALAFTGPLFGVPVVAMIGLVLLWVSTRWTRREKTIATTIITAGMAAAAIALVLGVVGLLEAAVGFSAIAAAVYLMVTLEQRRQ